MLPGEKVTVCSQFLILLKDGCGWEVSSKCFSENSGVEFSFNTKSPALRVISYLKEPI
jgi:hypothetical protein